MSRGFSSDNASGAHPRILEALAAANDGTHVPAYGDDPETIRFMGLAREHFGRDALAFPVFNGTGANVSAIAAVTRPFDAVICAAGAHLNVDEAGAPEAIGGVKLLTVQTEEGKLTPKLLQAGIEWERTGDVHASQPRVISITNATEVGTVYTPDEIAALAAFAHERDLLLHVDGARLANAAASLDLPLAAITTDAGVDIVSFGGTKNGLLAGEAVIFCRDGLERDYPYIRKQSMQLASKMRFFSAQLSALLTDDLWRENATHANAMATRLAEAITPLEGVELAYPVQANGVFTVLPASAIEHLANDEDGRTRFYVWEPQRRVCRLMCSWDTTPEDVDDFAAALSATSHG